MSELHLPFHFLLVLLLCSLCCVSASSSFSFNFEGVVDCHPNKIQVLTQFKNEFDSIGCNQTEYYFNGVGCDNTTGEITILRIPSGCFTGILKPNSSLFRLHHLRLLDFDHNGFTSSSLPSEFGNLNKLEVLSLSSNGFHGKVPSSFSNLSMLSFLDLSYNHFTDSFPLLRNLIKLSILDLSNNRFFGTIPSSLFTMPFLYFLDLGVNELTSTGPIEIPNSSSSIRLEFMYLENNNFEGNILEPISKLITLKRLDLSFLNINQPIDLSFFSSLKSLVSLELSGNRISPASLSSDSGIPLSMEILYLSGCNVSEFPNILKPLKNLTNIDLSNNQLKGKVPAWLWKLPFLSSVTLAGNSLDGFKGSAEVLVNTSLQMLQISFNHFRVLPNLPLSIITLYAQRNHLTGNIPLSLCNQSSLRTLMLAENNFTGPVPQCLSNLTSVWLRRNNLEGSLPDMFYTGASLRALDVGYNQLSGKLPRSLLNCSSLQFLCVDYNRIEDSFPFWLKALPNLQILIIRSNNFYGPISPPDQGPLGFPELRILEISDNNFTGTLPPSYFVNWKGSSLTNERIYMGYRDTGYKGVYILVEFPIDLKYKGLSMEQQKVFNSYSAIDFSGNKIEGHIPESIGLLKTLIALNLSNNAFTGHIPPSFANFTELESLDLSRNQLSGTIPNGLKTLTFLAYMNVSHNQLKGKIPQGTQITGQPKSSFEGNARLCGLPLEESCVDISVPPTQQVKQEDEDKEEGEVLNWKAVAIGYAPGVLFGLAIGQVIAIYKPEWLVKIMGLYKRKNR